MKPPRNTVDLRQANTQVILRHLYLNGPLSRLDLSEQTGLSPSTVTNVVSELFQAGMIVEKGLEESLGGRPRTILDINPEYGYLIGVDLGEEHVELELFDLQRRKLGLQRVDFEPDSAIPEQLVGFIAEACQQLIRSTGIPAQKILGMGVGAPGIVEHTGPVSLASPMWKWQPVPLLEMLESATGLPVYIDNGAKAMTLAEAWFGAGRGAQDLAVILIGTGIGAGIITKGSLYRGATNSAGEWGHTKIVLDGRPCRCGSQGCLEAYAGAPGIIASLQEATNTQSTETANDQQKTIARLVQDYQQNDPLATQVLKKTARMLGAGIANLVNLFNPERIVIGGWVGLLIGVPILDELNHYVKKYALPLSAQNLEIELCQFGQEAICTGAACLVLGEILAANPKFYHPGTPNTN